MTRARRSCAGAGIAGIASLVVPLGGCALLAGLERAHLIQVDGGPGGGSSTTTSSGGGGTGGGTTSSHGGGGAGVCTAGQTSICYDGPAGTQGVGICVTGVATCNPERSGFGKCEGEVVPQLETCADPADENCDGYDCVQWVDVFGGLSYHSAQAVAVDTSGNIWVAGSFVGAIVLPQTTLTAAGNADVFLLKLDPTGKPLWGKSFGAAGVSAHVNSLGVDSTGNVVLYGSIVGVGGLSFGGPSILPSCIYVAKLTSDGAHVWSKGFGSSPAATALAITSAGDVVIGGYFQSSDIDFGAGSVHHNTTMNPYGFLAKLDASTGSGVWSRTACGDATSYCRVDAVAQDSHGLLDVAVEFHGKMSFAGPVVTLNSIGSQDLALTQLAQDATPNLQKHLGAAGLALTAYGLAADGSGGVVLVGRADGTVDLGAGPVQGGAFVVRYGPDQSHTWSQVVKGPDLYAVAAFGAGNAAVVGNPLQASFTIGGTSFPAGNDAAVLMFSSTGTFQWGKVYETAGGVFGVAVEAQGAPIFVGSASKTVDFGTGPLTLPGGDAIVVKLSP